MIVATSWPVCHTPPRTVIDHSAVLKAKKAVSQIRVRIPSANRAISAQASAADVAARAALMVGSQGSSGRTPKTATSGMRRAAGSGANGT